MPTKAETTLTKAREALAIRLANIAARTGADVFHPGDKVALLYRVNGQDYPVNGYRIFFEEELRPTGKGKGKINLKKLRTDHIWVIGEDDPGSIFAPTPFQRHISTVLPIRSGKHYFKFEEVFGSNSAPRGDNILEGIVIESEEDDLTIGVSYTEAEEE